MTNLSQKIEKLMSKTKQKILDSAEILFAEHGFSETSLRIITSVAEVNLAAVNYHFGSKKDLIQAVLDRYCVAYCNELDGNFNAFESGDKQLTTESLLACLMQPLVKLNAIRPDGAATFMRLLGRAYTESQGHLKRFMREKYGHMLDRFTVLIRKANPKLDNLELFWRLHFMLGTLVFAMAGHQALSDIAQADFEETIDTEGIMQRLLPFLSAAMQPAPAQ
jgi:AcrR family transcriptional regulator